MRQMTVILFASLLWLNPVLASSKSNWHLSIVTQLDRFQVVNRNGRISYVSRTVDPLSIQPLLKLFSTELVEDCPEKLGKFDLQATLTQKRGSVQSAKRILYLKEQTVSDGKNCGTIDGPGFYRLPYHRSWFSGSKKLTIALKPEFSIEQQKKKIASFRFANGEWQNNDSQALTNWEYLKKFRQYFTKFSVNGRLHFKAAEGSEPLTLSVHDKKYVFYQLKSGAWGVRYPNRNYLIVSNSFAVLNNMSPEKWTDPQSAKIRVLKDANADSQVRKQALDDLGSYWSRSLKLALQELIVDADVPSDVKLDVIEKLRRHPSDDTVGVAVDALFMTQDRLVQRRLIRILRTRKRGPTIDPDIESTKDQETLNFWKNWKKSGFKK